MHLAWGHMHRLRCDVSHRRSMMRPPKLSSVASPTRLSCRC
jgi:hypothetical protein